MSDSHETKLRPRLEVKPASFLDEDRNEDELVSDPHSSPWVHWPKMTSRRDRVCVPEEPDILERLRPKDNMSRLDPVRLWQLRRTEGEEQTERVDKVGFVRVSKGLRLRREGNLGASDRGIAPFGTRVYVSKKTKHGWCYVTVLPQRASGSRGSAEMVGFSGYVEGR